MRRKNQVAALTQIAKIRDLQRAAAEFSAARAASDLREKTEVRRESERERGIVEEHWLQSLSMPSLRMAVTPLWAAALLRQDNAVREASRDVDMATAELDRRKADWHAATTRLEVAQDMARKALRERARHREEAALHEASERHAQRGSAL